MFDTHSEEWERVGLAVDFDKKSLRSARRRVAGPGAAVHRGDRRLQQLRELVRHHPTVSWETPIQVVTVLALLALGWAIARDIGRVAGPTFFRRMDPGTAGTVGFLVRLVTVGITLLVALEIAGVSAASLVADKRVHRRHRRSRRAADARQPVRRDGAAERATVPRRRARPVPGRLPSADRSKGIVSSLGLLYTTLAQGEDRIMVPNNVVLSAVVVPIREPDSVDVKVRLGRGIRVTQVQAILDDRVKTPTRRKAAVLLEQLDGDDVVVRVQATPDRADDGARLADEIIDALATVTGEHVTLTGE